MVRVSHKQRRRSKDQEPLYHADAEGSADHFGQIAVRDALRSLGTRNSPNPGLSYWTSATLPFWKVTFTSL